MTSEEYALEWRKIQDYLASPACLAAWEAETRRYNAWMNLTFGMNLRPKMTPEELTAYFNTWNAEHGLAPLPTSDERVSYG